MADMETPLPAGDPPSSSSTRGQRNQGMPLPLAGFIVILSSCCLGCCLAYFWPTSKKETTASLRPGEFTGSNQPAAAPIPIPPPAPRPQSIKPEYIIDSTPEIKAPPAPPRTPLAADTLFQQASPAVVKILVQDAQNRSIGQGSGFVVNKRGMIVTNYHVIGVAKAHSAVVQFADRMLLPMIRIAALDREADLAVIVVHSGHVRAQPLELAAAALPLVGSKVFAIGYPLGQTSTLSDGLVSGHLEKNARITEILTNAAISPGSSGGPLLAADGRVVGVTTGSFTKGQNLNIVVPSSYVAEVLRRCD